MIESRITNKSQLRTPSESRIIERKQIQKRLQNLSAKQLQRVHGNLVRQNEKLREQVTTFNEKVKKLLQSKKYETEFKPNPQIQQQILKIKKQLQSKYDTMNELKQQIQTQKSKLFIEQTSTNSKQKRNQIRSIQIQIEELLKEKDRLLVAIKDNEIDFQQYLPTRDLSAQIQVFREDNKVLKKKAYNMSVEIKDNERKAKQALTRIYSLKKETQNLQNPHSLSMQSINPSKMNRIKSLSVLSNHEGSKGGNQLSQLKALQQQIQTLRRKKQDVQSELTVQRSAKLTAKEKKQKEITQLLEYHKRLFKRRVRELTELNYLEKKQADIRLQKQLELQRAKIPLEQKAQQTQNLIRKLYSKDWIGKTSGEILFDDTQLLEFKETCLVNSLLIYRATDRIVFIRFGYEHPQTKYKYQTRVPFDKEALKKIQNKKITSKNNGHLTGLILSITKNIITRVESLWSDGDSNVQGWETEDSSKYRLDIGDNQRPIAFYGTLVPHPKGFYALQSLGCQILQPHED